MKMNQTIANFSDPEEKETYKIVKIEEKDITGLKGLVMNFEPTDPTPDTDKIEYKATLWYGQTKTVGSNSKLGAFMTAFQEFFEANEINKDPTETDNWIGHIVKINSWEPKNRKVTIIK